MAPMQDAMWIELMSLPSKELTIQRRRDRLFKEAAKPAPRKGDIGVLRDPKAPLKATRTIAARDISAFEREVRIRFYMSDESIIAYAELMALQPKGRRATGFIARVEADGKSCDLAIAGYSENVDSAAIVAVARRILCNPVSTLTPPRNSGQRTIEWDDEDSMSLALLGKTDAACVLALALGAATLSGASAKLGGDPAEATPAQVPRLSNKNGIILLTRAKHGRLNQKAADPTLSPVAISKELGKTFIDDEGEPPAHTRPVSLLQTDNLASRLVAKVDGLENLCAFALGG